MQRGEAVILGLIDGGTEREVGQDESNGAHVASEGSMVESIEAIVVSDSMVGLKFYQ